MLVALIAALVALPVSAATHVQDDSAAGVGVALAVAFTSDVTAGNVVVVGASWGDSGVTGSVADDDSNSYTAMTLLTHASGGRAQLYWATVGSSGALTVTWTPTGSTGRTVFLSEAQDADTPPSAEEGDTGDSGTALDSGDGETAGDDSIVYAQGASPNRTQNWTAGTGFTLVVPNQSFGQSEYNEVASSTTQDATMTQDVSDRWLMTMLVLDNAAVGGPPSQLSTLGAR